MKTIQKRRKNTSSPKVYFPKNQEDLEQALMDLKNHIQIIINVMNIDSLMRYRIIDFLSGYTIALGGTREKLDDLIYCFYI